LVEVFFLAMVFSSAFERREGITSPGSPDTRVAYDGSASAAFGDKEERVKYRETMRELKAMGTEQNRKVYARHGVHGKMFGVSYANLGKLRKRIKVDQELAEQLWASGNHDARVLAAMIADPGLVRSSTLDKWARDLDSYQLTDAFGGLVGRTAFARTKMRKWTKSNSEYLGRKGEEPSSLFDEQRPDRHRPTQSEAGEEGARGRAANRQGRGRPR
jgi:hypothetical protein